MGCRLVDCRLLIEPRERAIDHCRRRTFGFEPLARVGIAPDLIVVGVEPLREAEAAVEDERADERGGAVAGPLQQARDRRMRLRPRSRTVLADALLRRQPGG